MQVQPWKYYCTKCGNYFRTRNGDTICTYGGGFCQPPHHWPSGEEGGEGPASDTPGGGTVFTAAGVNKAGDNETDHYAHRANAPPNPRPNYRGNDKEDSFSQVKPSNNQFKRQGISVVFNESSIELTEPMLNLLNRGLNFIILPLKLDITQTLVEFKRFERSIIWHEFWFGRENQEQTETPLFKTQKNNLPKN